MDRMFAIERTIKARFGQKWTSTRRAFLDLDMDYDGKITSDDIARHLGKGVDYKDLKTLVINRDSKRRGRINYTDFCKWMANAIEPLEEFYFRHDSNQNPPYTQSMKTQNQVMEKDREMALKSLV